MGQTGALILGEASSIDTRTVEDSAFQHLMEATQLAYRGAPLVDDSRTDDSVLKTDIIEKGNHASLMEQRGFYHTLSKSVATLTQKKRSRLYKRVYA